MIPVDQPRVCDLWSQGGRAKTCESFQGCRPLIQPCSKAARLHLGSLSNYFSLKPKRTHKLLLQPHLYVKSIYLSFWGSISVEFLRVFELFFFRSRLSSLDCLICCERMDDGERMPMLSLGCGHNIGCKKCVAWLSEQPPGGECVIGNWCLMFDAFWNKRVCSLSSDWCWTRSMLNFWDEVSRVCFIKREPQARVLYLGYPTAKRTYWNFGTVRHGKVTYALDEWTSRQQFINQLVQMLLMCRQAQWNPMASRASTKMITWILIVYDMRWFHMNTAFKNYSSWQSK